MRNPLGPSGIYGLLWSGSLLLQRKGSRDGGKAYIQELDYREAWLPICCAEKVVLAPAALTPIITRLAHRLWLLIVRTKVTGVAPDPPFSTL
jgi:hypothetical protein